jgi:hypothetical protein
MQVNPGNLILIFALIFAFLLIFTGLVLSKVRCPPPVIEYRFIPRTFEEEQNNPPLTSDVFQSMFDNTPLII